MLRTWLVKVPVVSVPLFVSDWDARLNLQLPWRPLEMVRSRTKFTCATFDVHAGPGVKEPWSKLAPLPFDEYKSEPPAIVDTLNVPAVVPTVGPCSTIIAVADVEPVPTTKTVHWPVPLSRPSAEVTRQFT